MQPDLDFFRLADMIPAGIYLTDMDGKCFFVNRAWCAHAGLSPEEALGNDWIQGIHPEDRDMVNSSWERMVTSQGTWGLEFRFTTPDGQVTWVLGTVTPYLDPEGKIIGYIGTNTDINATKLAERDRLEMEQKYQTLFESAVDAIFLIDLEGNYQDVNNRACELTGYTRAELLGMGIRQLISSDRSLALFATMLEEGSVRGEFPLLRKNGQEVQVEISASVIAIGDAKIALGIVHDISERVLVASALRESEERYRHVFEHSFSAKFIIDLERRKIIEVNEVACDWLEYSSDEILEMSFNDFVDPATLKTSPLFDPEKMEDFRTKGRATFEVSLLSRSGRRIPVEINSLITEINGMTVAISNARDLTEKIQAQKAIHMTEANFRNLVETSQDHIWRCDVQGNFTYLNPVWEKSHGYTIEEMLGRHYSSFHPPGDTASHFEAQRRIIEGSIVSGHLSIHETKTGELLYLRATGAPIHDLGGEIIGSQGTAHDITEELKAEMALRESEERYRALFEKAGDAIMVVNLTEDGLRITDCNNRALEMFRITREEFIGHSPLEFSPELQPDGTPSKVNEGEIARSVLDGHQATFEWTHLRSDDMPFPTEVTLTAIEMAEGIRILTIIRDITERQKIQAEIHRLNANLEARVRVRTLELEAANRELEAFSYSVSHDLRAPLRTIDGYSLLLQEELGQVISDQARQHIERIRRASQKQAILIDELLALSRVTLSEMEPEVIDLSALVSKVAGDIATSQPDRIVEFSAQPGASVVGDRLSLTMMLNNLLENAWKYTSKVHSPKVSFSFDPVEEPTVYSIADNGVGFEMEFLAKIFSPFQRLHDAEEFPGSGIGLAIVQRIISRHRGEVWAEATPGEGATFFFTLEDLTTLEAEDPSTEQSSDHGSEPPERDPRTSD